MLALEQQAQLVHGLELPRGLRAGDFSVYIRDLRNLPGPKIMGLKSVLEDEWFPRGREDCDPRFWTILQESFYASCVRGDHS
jgi:hypothetical protein